MGISASVRKVCCLNDFDPEIFTEKRATNLAATTDQKRETLGKDDMQRDRLGQWANGDSVCPSKISGVERLRSPGLNKDQAFTLQERQSLGIHGLLPPRVLTQEDQVAKSKACIDRLDDDLNKYVFLMNLLATNEKVFYRLMKENTEQLMPLVYTPVVGLACQNFGLVYRRPKGLFISIHDKGHVYDVLRNWPEQDVRVIVVTDGERILGLGDLGANGMGIPIGKLALYTALAGVKPHQTLPITLDCGTNTQKLLDDPLYVGHKHKRVSGQVYDDFIDEFMEASVRKFGQSCLIQFEDFGNSNAFRFLNKYRDVYCTFNDDIQGTASVAVAGLLASLRVTKKKLSDNVILFQGAGEANIGIANLCVMAMAKEGLDAEEARKQIWMVDSKGLIVANRPGGGITEHKAHFAHKHAPVPTLVEAVKTLKPSILIGAAAIGGAFTKEILQEMATNNEKPVIFALSNPTHKAECTAEEAYTATDGRCIFATGSPFDPVTYKGKTFYPGQGNNSYIFPAVGLAVICGGIQTISEEIFLMAAKSLSQIVKQEDLDRGTMYPPLSTIQDVSVEIATEIVEHSYQIGIARTYPEPKDKEAFIRSQMYSTDYEPAVPPIYEHPL